MHVKFHAGPTCSVCDGLACFIRVRLEFDFSNLYKECKNLSLITLQHFIMVPTRLGLCFINSTKSFQFRSQVWLPLLLIRQIFAPEMKLEDTKPGATLGKVDDEEGGDRDFRFSDPALKLCFSGQSWIP